MALLKWATAVGDDAAQICVFCFQYTCVVSNLITGSTSGEDQEKDILYVSEFVVYVHFKSVPGSIAFNIT